MGLAVRVAPVARAVMVALAIWLDVAASPPFWVHALLWVPLTIAAVVGGLRVSKAALLAAEYRNRAGEAVSSSSDDEDSDA